MSHPTYKECANDYDLWLDYVDPNNKMELTVVEFYNLNVYTKVVIQIGLFGKE